jgi:hypothetical protein
MLIGGHGGSAGASEARTDEVARTEKTEANSRAKGKDERITAREEG